jgi:hypothetical protein
MTGSASSDEAWPGYALPFGTVVNGYRLERVLGSGGFGVTYLAHDLLQQRFAIKEYFPRQFAVRQGAQVVAASGDDAAMFEECRARFLREAQALVLLGRVAGPGDGIVRVQTFFESHGTCFLVMDYVEGGSLASVLRQQPDGLAAPRLRALLTQLLASIRIVHGAGLMHRDIKPANIILGADDRLVLIDFGSTREATTGQTTAFTQIYSGGYAPPEQMLGLRQGPFSDIYAIGAVCYRAIGGTVVDALTRQNAVAAGQPDPQPPAQRIGAGRYPQPLLAAIDAALQTNAQRRPSTADALLALIGDADRTAATVVMQPARRSGRQRPPGQQRPVRRRIGWRLAAGIGALAICGGGGYLLWSRPSLFPQGGREVAGSMAGVPVASVVPAPAAPDARPQRADAAPGLPGASGAQHADAGSPAAAGAPQAGPPGAAGAPRVAADAPSAVAAAAPQAGSGSSSPVAPVAAAPAATAPPVQPSLPAAPAQPPAPPVGQASPPAAQAQPPASTATLAQPPTPPANLPQREAMVVRPLAPGAVSPPAPSPPAPSSPAPSPSASSAESPPAPPATPPPASDAALAPPLGAMPSRPAAPGTASPASPGPGSPAAPVAASPASLLPERPSLQEAVRAAAASLDCAVLGVAGTATGQRLRGFAPAGQGLEHLLVGLRGAGQFADGVTRVDRFACAPIQALGRFVEGTWDSAAPRLALRLNHPEIAVGSRLAIDVQPAPAVVYVDLYQRNGVVRHLLRPAPRGGGSRSHAEWTAEPPAGSQLLVAIGAAATLDLGLRPDAEDASAYLAALQPRLQALGGPPVVDLAIVTVRAAEARGPQAAVPQRAAPLRPDRCANIVSRAQMGEALSDAELAALRSECRS